MILQTECTKLDPFEYRHGRMTYPELYIYIKDMSKAIIECQRNIDYISRYVEPFMFTALEHQKREIYKILKELQHIDLSEEEFLQLFNGGD